MKATPPYPYATLSVSYSVKTTKTQEFGGQWKKHLQGIIHRIDIWLRCVEAMNSLPRDSITLVNLLAY